MNNFFNFRRFICLSCFFLFFVSCNSKFHKNETFREDSRKLLNTSDLIDTNFIQTIVLETTSGNLISRVKQIFLTENHLFILNKIPSEIFMFDKDGKYIRKIGQQGRGAGEYLNIENIYVDENKQEIVLLDSKNCKIFIYNYNGDFIKTISNKHNPYGHVARLNDTLYCLNNRSNKTKIENNPSVLILNDKGELVKSFHSRMDMIGKRSVIPISLGSAFFTENKTGKYYVPLGSDTIFHLFVRNGEVITKPILSLGIKDYFFPPDISQKEYNDNIEQYFDPFQALVVNDRGIFYGESAHGGKVISIIGDLEKGIDKVGIMVDNHKSWPFMITPQAAYKDYFVGVIESTMAREYRNNYFHVPEDSNPVVVLFKFKTERKI